MQAEVALITRNTSVTTKLSKTNKKIKTQHKQSRSKWQASASYASACPRQEQNCTEGVRQRQTKAVRPLNACCISRSDMNLQQDAGRTRLRKIRIAGQRMSGRFSRTSMRSSMIFLSSIPTSSSHSGCIFTILRMLVPGGIDHCLASPL